MSGRRTLNIAPRPVDASSSGPAVEADDPQPLEDQTQFAGPSSRKKVTSACQGCQKRRVKCDGQQPCGSCKRSKSQCNYTRELDGRSIKRKFHEVQRDQDLLHDLLDTIRNSRDEDVSQVITLIRSSASLDDVKACMAQQLIDLRLMDRERSPEFHQLQSNIDALRRETGDQTRPLHRPDILGIPRLADKPLYKLSASPWTTVIDDDDLVSNLISSWLTWDKGWHDWIDEDLFIRDMQSGDLESMFCSPFLVNCLLAWGCPYSEYKEARSTNGSISPLVFKFVAEAKRLLELETTITTGLCMTTVQGLLFLHGTLAVCGQDQNGYRYMLQAIGMTQDLLASAIATNPHPDRQMAQDVANVIDRTSWGVFIITTQTMAALLKPQAMKPPRRPRPGQGHQRAQPREWIPYPYNDEPTPFFRDGLFEFGCDLAILEAELSQLLFDKAGQPRREELEPKILDIYNRLQQRVAELPRQLNPTIKSCPALFSHQARIQSIILRMFIGLREPVENASPRVMQMAQTRCIDAAVETAQVCKLYMESWSASLICILVAQPCLMALTVLLEEPDTSRYYGEITDLCIALRGMSRRWPICMGMLRMVQLNTRLKGWQLPPQTAKLFEEFEGSAWKQREMKRYVTLYPMTESTKTNNLTGDEIDMGKFLESMEMLDLELPTADPDPA